MNRAQVVDAADMATDRATLPLAHSVKRFDVLPPGAMPTRTTPQAGQSRSSSRMRMPAEEEGSLLAPVDLAHFFKHDGCADGERDEADDQERQDGERVDLEPVDGVVAAGVGH